MRVLVEFYLHDYVENSYIRIGCPYTNSSGMVTLLWTPREYLERSPHRYVYFVIIVEVNETANILGDWVRVVVDARYETVLES